MFQNKIKIFSLFSLILSVYLCTSIAMAWGHISESKPTHMATFCVTHIKECTSASSESLPPFASQFLFIKNETTAG